MEKELHNIIEFYRKSDNSLIGYFMSDFDLTDNINRSKLFKFETNLSPLADTMLKMVYKKDWNETTQSMSKHAFGHLFYDWFKDINKNDVTYRFIIYENELRRLKMKNIKKKT